MFNKFSEESKKIIAYSKKEMIKLKHPYLGSEHLMLGLLKDENNISNILKKYGITYKNYKNEVIKMLGVGDVKINYVLYTPIVKEIFERAIEISNEQNSNVSIDNIFTAIIEIGDGIAFRILKKLKLDFEKIYSDIIFKVPKKNSKKKSILDDIGIEFTDSSVASTFEPVIGREEEIKQVIEILIRKNKCNPLLVGEAGVGKSAIVEEISRMISENNVPNKLKGKKIINIDMSLTVAGTKYRGEFEEKLNKIIKEAENNDDIILFIDEVHTIVGAGGAEGAIDASNIFKPALARGKIKCIGATTIEEYKKYIEKDKALERRFKKIVVEEPNIEKVRMIIDKLRPIYENYHHVSLDDNIITMLIDLTNKYIHNYNNPDKTIDVLDEVCAHAYLKENKYMKEYNYLNEKLYSITKDKEESVKKGNFKIALEYKQRENEMISRINDLEFILSTTKYNKVTRDDLLYVLSNKVNIPILESHLKQNNSKMLKKLQSTVIGHKKEIEKMYESYINNRNNDECFSILINGPTGVGKTYLATKFASIIGYKFIRIDMSEYSESHTISKLVGAPPGYVGYENNNYLFSKIKQYPFSVILLDEIEKANQSVLNLFIKILDDNKITDSNGNEIYFNNVIIIMTTNICKNNLGFNKFNNNELYNYFSKSLLNRINEIIELNTLKKEDVIKIIRKNSECKYIDNDMTNSILNMLKYEEFGVKRLKNAINSTINRKKIKKFDKNYSKN